MTIHKYRICDTCGEKQQLKPIITRKIGEKTIPTFLSVSYCNLSMEKHFCNYKCLATKVKELKKEGVWKS